LSHTKYITVSKNPDIWRRLASQTEFGVPASWMRFKEVIKDHFRTIDLTLKELSVDYYEQIL